MKLNKLFLMGAVALGLGLTACDKNQDEPNPDNGKTAYMTVSLSLKSSLRAGGDANANDAEVKVNTVDVFVIQGNKFKSASFPIADYTAGTGNYMPKKEAVMEVPSGSNDVYVAVNLSGAQRTKLNAAGVNAFTDVFEETVANVTNTTNGFVMVSTEKVTATGVADKDDAIATPVDVTVERVVGKVAVEVADAVADGTAVNGGTISDVKFTIRNQNTKLYYMKKNANYEDPNYSADAGTFGDYTSTENPDKLVSMGAVTDKGTLTSTHVAYALENTNPTDYKNGNTTYALIEAIYTPTAIADGGSLTGGTFYVGNVDHKIYSTSSAANTAGNSSPTEYTDGKVYYHVWIGQEDVTKADAPFKRNHFYNIKITKINGVGAPNDPVNDLTPGDPIATSLYLAAEVTVQKWTYVEREIEL